MSIRRDLSWKARQSSMKMKRGSKKAAVSCWGDFVTPPLIPIKLIFFFIMGATQCVAPYGTIFFKKLGLTVEEAGIIYAISPVIPMFAPLIAGFIADKKGNIRIFLVVVVAISGLGALINLCIPPARSLPKQSVNMIFDITCSSQYVLTPNMKSKECIFLNKTVEIEELKAESCGYLCHQPVIHYTKELQKKFNKISFRLDYNATLYHECEVVSQEFGGTQKCYRVNTNVPKDNENIPKKFSIYNVFIDLENFYVFGFLPVVNNYTYLQQASNVACPKLKVPRTIAVPSILVTNESQSRTFISGSERLCHFHCLASVPFNAMCRGSKSKEQNVSLTLWLFVATGVFSSFMTGLTYTLFEVAVVAVLKEFKHDYGLQRIYGSFGGMTFAPLTGLLIDYLGSDHYSDYYFAFVLFCIVKLLCCALLLKLDLTFRSPTRSICRNVWQLLTNCEIIALIFAVFVSGMCYGFIENFLPWHLSNLKATNWLIGLTTTVAAIAALPFLALSGIICKKFGHIQAIMFGLFCYAIRCVGYSMLVNPYWCLPIEVLEGVTTGLLVTSAIIYGAYLSSKENVATLQGILASFHYGLGKSAGSYIGSHLMGKWSAPAAFQIFAGIATVFSFVYYLILKLVFVPRRAKKERIREDILMMPIQTISPEEFISNTLKRNIQLIRSQDGPQDIDNREDILEEATKVTLT